MSLYCNKNQWVLCARWCLNLLYTPCCLVYYTVCVLILSYVLLLLHFSTLLAHKSDSSLGLGIVWIWSIPILLIDSDLIRIPVWLKKVKHLDIQHVYSVSLFAKHLVEVEYLEQKSTGYTTPFTLVRFRFKTHNFCYAYGCRLHYCSVLKPFKMAF